MFLMGRLVAAILMVLAIGAHVAQGQPKGSDAFVFTEADLKLLQESEAVEGQFDRRGLVYHDAAIEEHLGAVAHASLPRVPLEHVQWRFRVLRDPLVNAFALPNGSIYVNTGMLALLGNDDQLAGVLEHEVAHVINRHAYRGFRDYRRKQLGVHLFQIGTSLLPFPIGAAAYVISRISEPMAVAVTLGYGVEFERNADQFSVAELVHGGRDPVQIIRTLEQMDKRLDPEPILTFYTDHSRIKERMAYVRQLIGVRAEAAIDGSGYIRVVEAAIRQNIQMDLESRRFRTAVARGQRMVTAHPDDPQDLCLLAEAYLSLGPRAEGPSLESWTMGGQRKANKQMINRTEGEDYRSLAATAEGRAALQANQLKAEELLQRAAGIDATQARPHRGLGMLFEQQGHVVNAVGEYIKYLELAPAAPDRLRIQRRMKILDSTQTIHQIQ